jgi:hypothetical protein
MKLLRIILFLSSAIIVVLISVRLQTPEWEPKPITHPFLVGSENCRPPCWEGIIPGETSYDEALSIVENIPFVNDEGYFRVDDDFRGISWVSGDGSTAVIYLYDSKVDFMRLNFSTKNYEIEGIDLGSLMNHYGEPDGYEYYPSDDHYAITVYYPVLGLVFVVYQGLDEPISEDMHVSHVYFLYPMDPIEFPITFHNMYKRMITEMYTLFTPKITKSPYQDWEGFGVYPSEMGK